ncbi:MAG: polysaccharide deacetylase family protein [Gemmatimonadaceae bacterium]|nr:polysaccharide deacetylase family protein [Gemmatimonadaceae bacterium]
MTLGVADRLARAIDWRWTRWRRRRSPRGVVLCYHRIASLATDPQRLAVTPADFAAQLAWLSAHTTPLALEEFSARRAAGTLPPRATAITFDDGYADNLHAAAPALAAAALPATIFVTSGMTGVREEFWWDAVERAVLLPVVGRARWTLPAIGIDVDASGPPPAAAWCAFDPNASARTVAYRAILGALRGASPDARDRVLRQLLDDPAVPSVRASHLPLDRDELRALAHTPRITLGAHTRTHPALAQRPYEEQRAEIAHARDALTAIVGRPIVHAAYPFGTADAVDRATERAAAAEGFEAGWTTDARAAWRGDRPLHLPRLVVTGGWDLATFTARIEALFDA